MNTLKTIKETMTGNLLFIKEVAKYFMDFLETDFHKHKFPRRSIKFRNNDNLLVGLNLQKYQSFSTSVIKFINGGFTKEAPITIEKGVYKTNLPKNLLDLIHLQIGKITDEQISTVAERIGEEVEKASTLYAKEYDVALTSSIEEATKIVRSELVLQFVESIEKPLQNLNLGDEDNVYIIEDELTSVLVRLLENKISEVLNLRIAKEEVDAAKELQSVFAPQDLKSNLATFFENLQVADLFLELFEMERNKSILDKQEFYLYFGDIAFNNTKYPIFYIPFTFERVENTLRVEFDAQVYINKKALEYVVQEHNSQKETHGNLQTITERIIYLSQHQSDFASIINGVLGEVSNFFGLEGEVSFSNGEHSFARSSAVRISNSCYVCLFDKSDEALVNDYEAILQQLSQEEGELAEIFNTLVEDFIHKNPESFNPQVEDEWDNADTADKLVYTSPIPLNSEQRQILSAIRNDGCKYIIVEGPPGTGKSHTITAIAFDAILKNQSVLVLSDKKEALDVVEDKITQTMNKVRYNEHFQNPILRLGKTGNTYNSILARSAIEEIKTHYRAVKKDYETLEETIIKSANSLKEDLEAEILAYNEVSLQEIHEYFDLELYFRDKASLFDAGEISADDESVIELGDLRGALVRIREVFSSHCTKRLFGAMKIHDGAIQTFDGFSNFIQFLSLTSESVESVKKTFPHWSASVAAFPYFEYKDLETLRWFIQEYTKLKSPLFGYLFAKKSVEKLDVQFKQRCVHANLPVPHKALGTLRDALEIYDFAQQLGNEIHKERMDGLDYVALIHQLLTDDDFLKDVQGIVTCNQDTQYLKDMAEKYPKTTVNVGINLKNLSTVINNRIISTSEDEYDKQIRHLNLKQKVSKDFSHILELHYASRMKQIEDLVTTRVTYLLDGRVIDFTNNNKSDAEALRTIIRNKLRFPKHEFGKLKEAFPCILAGIRDYAEYIPLEPEIFDLVIIDEASQVSIAQAFPALLRAKKVLILGDKKQFSNVKAAQARSDTNREYLNNLETTFMRNVSTEATKLVRLKKFNIKTSILEFFEFISNYSTQLLKHFRGYKEIISYSNKYFYRDSLQVMKIRGKSIDDVIKYSFLQAEKKDELYPNTNIKEVEFIISELKSLKDAGKQASVGIITPHTNQQKLLVEKLSKLPEWDFFINQFQLKIMTFDTCQGEERDIVYYSMVASPHSDKLWGVFIKDLNSVDIEEDGKIKAQRLNVGFSRAKERIHFVLSKPIENIAGSIGEALRHYQFILEEAHKERSVSEVDEKSKKEPEVLNWFYQTQFWQRHKDTIEFVPQFEIGKYLKQLDHTYSHPEYKVDFLLVYTDERHKEHKIIIEYDGFQEHFKELEAVNKFNYEQYYTDAHVYRQKVLESYGYKFLRLNRFNVGENPIATIDERISRLLKAPETANSLLTNIHETVEGLQNGDMKECPKCKEVKSLADFKDSSLISGMGRFCKDCKGRKVYRVSAATKTEKPAPVLSDLKCPRCNTRMVVRNGRRGRFYGCSRFPYCRGTRSGA